MSDPQKLLPCPWCGNELYVRRSKMHPYAACKTKDCYGTRLQVVSLHDPRQVEAWNRRATPPEDNRLKEALIFANDMLDQLINRHYGGELPCSAAEANGFKKIRAALSHGEDDNGK